MPETTYLGFTIFLGVPEGEAGQALNDNFVLCADHIADLVNPHVVTASQVGNTVAQWNASLMQGRTLAATAPTGGQVLSWNAGTSEWEPAASGAGGDHATMTNLAYAASGHTGFEATGVAAAGDAAHLAAFVHADIALNTADRHTAAHTIASHSDTTATGAELETLTDGSDADALHAHAVNDTHVAGDGSDHADVAANTVLAHAAAHTVASHSDTTATGAELETLTDGSNADALHTHTGVGGHTIASHTDTTATGAELETLTDGSNADALHVHAWSVLTGTPTTLAGYGISDTKANFDTALSDGTFMYTGDAPTAHTIVSHDTTGTGAQLTTLTDTSNADALHIHDYAGLDVDLSAMIDTFEGMAFDKPSLSVVDDSGLQLDVETLGGGDMDFWIGDQRVTLDCTTGAGAGGTARVGLTAGADANTPATNYIYITAAGATGTLAASTTLPTGAFAWIGKIIVPDAVTWGTTGEYAIQRYTESFENDSRGLLSHAREKLRALGAVYISGCGQTLTITPGAPDTVHLEVASGAIYQLHRQTWPAIATGPYYYGNGTTIYEEIADLASALALADGTPITNTNRFNLVIWGAVNYAAGDCKIFVNLPTSVYPTDGAAQADADNSADYTVPDDMRSVAFMICRVAMKYMSTGGGDWTELGVYSLLGTPPGARSGGAGAVASTEFVDSTFRIFDNADATKMIAFEASTITTATTRTLTVPDASGTIMLVGDTPTAHTHPEADISDLGTTIAMVADNLSVFAATTSAQLAGVISNETGTGLLVFNDTPTIVTPTIASFANAAHDHTDAAGGGTIAEGSISDLGTTVAMVADNLSVFAATTSAQLAGVISNETGTGLLVFNDTPTIVTPTIASFANAAHDHTDAAGGGTITEASISDLGTTVAMVADNLSVFAATTSAQLAGIISNETGTGLLVFNDSPTIVTPTIASFANAAHDHTDAAGGGTITEASISDLGTTVAMVADNLSVFAATTSAQLAGIISNETGTGALVFATNPVLVTPALGTPASGALGNCTAYEGTAVVSTGESGGTKFLREDGDGTCSWQDAAGGGGGGTVQGTDATYDIQATLDGVTDGDPRGENSVDLSTIRSNAAMVASAAAATISGGEDNTASGPYSVIGGGKGSTVSGAYGSVGGGVGHTVAGFYGTVGGGAANSASGYYSTVGGGAGNTAAGGAVGGATVAGGNANSATGENSTVGGGNTNAAGGAATANDTTISGGNTNWAGDVAATVGGGVAHNTHIGSSVHQTTGVVSGTVTEVVAGKFSTIAGGQKNTASGLSSTVGGGQTNTSSGAQSTICGGDNNTATQGRSTVCGGTNNDATGAWGFVGGGSTNVASENYATISGGYNNTASDRYTTIGGGNTNTCSTSYGGTVGGGGSNTASGLYSTIGGGTNSSAVGVYATVGGGNTNSTTGSAYYGDTIGGGTSNVIDSSGGGTYGANTISGGYVNVINSGSAYEAHYNTIGGGNGNAIAVVANTYYGTIGGGNGNAADGYGGTIGGGTGNSVSGDYGTVGGGGSNTASAKYATVGGGYTNTASGYASTIPGGYICTADGDYSTCSGKYATASGYNGCFVFCDSNTAAPSGPAAADIAYFEVAGGLQLVTGAEGAGKHLLSDANGVGNWAVPDKVITVRVIDPGTALTSGNGKTYFTVPEEFNGMDLSGVALACYVTSTGNDPVVQLHNLDHGGGATDILTTECTIDAGELNSYTAAVPVVIDGTKDDVSTGDRIRVDVDDAGTDTEGLDVIMTFSMP